jgi:predicted GNAT family acetyltransferase
LGEEANARLNNEWTNSLNRPKGVPDAPFKTSWDELTLKRAIKLASDEGYDQIAFTTGKTQADRYKLSKYMNEVHFSGSNLTAYDKQGKAIIQQTGVTEDQLPELIGKEAAEKLLNQPKQGTLRSLVGQELEVGGEGMKGFYDKMLPKKLEKLSKRYDAKVKKTTMDTPDGPVEIWAMQLPDELKETVSTQGQPLFQLGAGVVGAGAAGTMLSSDEEPVQNFLKGGEVQPYMGDYVFPNRPRNYVPPTPTTTPADLERLSKQVGLIGLGFAPGAGMADYLGQFPSLEGGTEPSAVQNLQAGNYGTAALQGLGAFGDMMYAVPFLGATVGTLAKVPRTAQKMLQELTTKNPLDLNVSKTDASEIFGEGAQRVKYQDKDSGGFIEVVATPDGNASVLSLEVPEQSRKQGIGEKLQAQVMQDFPVMQGQVSSKAAAKTAYRLGRRPPGQPDATLDDVLKMIDQDSSVNLVSPEALARMQKQLESTEMPSTASSTSAKEDLAEVEAPSVMTRSDITELADYIKNREGGYGLRRVERAADEIPRLGEMYTQDALQSAFSGDNARALMTMNPADFEKYATPIDPLFLRSAGYRARDDAGGKMSYEEYLKYLASVKKRGGFDDVPYLNINKEEQGLPLTPFLTGHEGRHRSRALTAAGEKAGLVQLLPRAELREPFPRRSQEEYIEALKREMAITDNKVFPQAYSEPSPTSLEDILIRRPAIDLPDLYAKGGEVRKSK